MLIYVLTLGQGEPAPPTWCLHLLEEGLLELIINRGNVKFGLKKTLIYFEDGMLIMFRTNPKEFGVLTNCASVKVGLFFLQICGIKKHGEVSCTISQIYTRVTKKFPFCWVKRMTKKFQKKKT